MRFYNLEGKIFLAKQVYTLDVMISNTEIEANRLPGLPQKSFRVQKWTYS